MLRELLVCVAMVLGFRRNNTACEAVCYLLAGKQNNDANSQFAQHHGTTISLF